MPILSGVSPRLPSVTSRCRAVGLILGRNFVPLIKFIDQCPPEDVWILVVEAHPDGALTCIR